MFSTYKILIFFQIIADTLLAQWRYVLVQSVADARSIKVIFGPTSCEVRFIGDKATLTDLGVFVWPKLGLPQSQQVLACLASCTKTFRRLSVFQMVHLFLFQRGLLQ